jgi:hypothetical protein
MILVTKLATIQYIYLQLKNSCFNVLRKTFNYLGLHYCMSNLQVSNNVNCLHVNIKCIPALDGFCNYLSKSSRNL